VVMGSRGGNRSVRWREHNMALSLGRRVAGRRGRQLGVATYAMLCF
jgi:hypothetical protein